jgi:hypothetical protein
MRTASDWQRGECRQLVKLDCSARAQAGMRHLHTVADAFSQMQQLRHTADYDNAMGTPGGSHVDLASACYSG